jgi:glutathione synthase/RimK-type ligase-like ATP-grasp enzyme
MPVLELLSATVEAVSFRYRSGEPQATNLHLANALRKAGFAAAHETESDGLCAIRVATADCPLPADVEALICATAALGAVAANGQPVPEEVVASIQRDGLQAYMGFAGLWRLMLSGLGIAQLGPMLDARVARDPRNAAALLDMATLLFLTLLPANRAHAFAAQQRALELQQVYRLPARRAGRLIRVLVVASPGDMTANTHVDCLVQDAPVELLILYVRDGRPLPAPLPQHDLVFIAIGESAPNRALLVQLDALVRSSPVPVLNRPEQILRLSRDRVAATLHSQHGIEMPQTVSLRRSELLQIAQGSAAPGRYLTDGSFPIIVRPLDSQGGKGLAKLENPPALAEYLRAATDKMFFVARFVDYRSADGMFRKYRVVFIQERAFACHMAISSNWMIHYVNADMDTSAAKRAEEARFMAEFDTGFGARHRAALERMAKLLGLDYFGIDCAETPDGKLLVFEADTAMLVHDMDPPDLYPYKPAQMRRLFDAFRVMLETAA